MHPLDTEPVRALRGGVPHPGLGNRRPHGAPRARAHGHGAGGDGHHTGHRLHGRGGRRPARELTRTCRPARLGTLHEQGNSHYAERPVLVLFNHSAALRHWDPLYTALGLGKSRNVTVVANKATLAVATQRMREVLTAPLPDVPPIWRSFVTTLMAPHHTSLPPVVEKEVGA